jgi:hypothetical protein
MTNQMIRTNIVLAATELGYGVNFRGPSDAHLCTIRIMAPYGAVVFKGHIKKALGFLNV